MSCHLKTCDSHHQDCSTTCQEKPGRIWAGGQDLCPDNQGSSQLWDQIILQKVMKGKYTQKQNWCASMEAAASRGCWAHETGLQTRPADTPRGNAFNGSSWSLDKAEETMRGKKNLRTREKDDWWKATLQRIFSLLNVSYMCRQRKRKKWMLSTFPSCVPAKGRRKGNPRNIGLYDWSTMKPQGGVPRKGYASHQSHVVVWQVLAVKASQEPNPSFQQFFLSLCTDFLFF